MYKPPCPVTAYHLLPEHTDESPGAAADHEQPDPTPVTQMQLISTADKERIWQQECDRSQDGDSPEPFNPDLLWWVLDLPEANPLPSN